jgi:hypothetical protein
MITKDASGKHTESDTATTHRAKKEKDEEAEQDRR